MKIQSKNTSVTGLKLFVIFLALFAFGHYVISEQLDFTKFAVFSFLMLLAVVFVFSRTSALVELCCLALFLMFIKFLSSQPQFRALAGFVSWKMAKLLVCYYVALIAVSLVLSKDTPRFYVKYMYIIALLEIGQWLMQARTYEVSPVVFVQYLDWWHYAIAVVFSAGLAWHYLKAYSYMVKSLCFVVMAAAVLWLCREIRVEGYTSVFVYTIATMVMSLGASASGKKVVEKTLNAKVVALDKFRAKRAA